MQPSQRLRRRIIMAVRIKKTKVYVSNVEIKKVGKKGEKPQYFVVADGSFMSARQNEKKENGLKMIHFLQILFLLIMV